MPFVGAVALVTESPSTILQVFPSGLSPQLVWLIGK
jgi:hypothetical protein